jgi:hypothetical protein
LAGFQVFTPDSPRSAGAAPQGFVNPAARYQRIP